MPSILYVNVPEHIVFPRSISDNERRSVLFEGIRASYPAYITPSEIISVAFVIMQKKNLKMPHDSIDLSSVSKISRRQISKAREVFVDSILQSISITVDDATITYASDGAIIDHTDKYLSKDQSAHYQTWVNGINKYLSSILECISHNLPIAYIATDPRRLIQDQMNPVVGVLCAQTARLTDGRALRLRKKSDIVITLTTSSDLATQLNGIVSKFTDLRHQRSVLQKDIDDGDIKLETQFTRTAWPNNPLVAHIKKDVREVVRQLIEDEKVICDPLDLEYQVLFRLTSIPLAVAFEHGDELDQYLQRCGAYDDWKNILNLDPKMVGYPVVISVVEDIAREQLQIILERIRGTSLPVAELTQREGIFAQANWRLQKVKGRVIATKVENEKVTEERKITFKPVDVAYAKELHRVLHYIHTPRAKKAFGLYLEGDQIPFSVVAFDAIDRPYKKDLLLTLGYDPEKCLDLARLYSKPGTPFNTSSTIFTLAFAYFRKNEPEIQAVLSAFMPTYAHGMSMISAGFNYGSLVKEWRHSFAKRTINGHECWELVTKRRINESQEIITSLWPLLPVFELVAELEPPRFSKFEKLEGKMISKDL